MISQNRTMPTQQNLPIKIFFPILIASAIFLVFPRTVSAAQTRDVVISEIMWMGTEANTSDEWIEFYNNTNQDIDLANWGIYEAGGLTLIEQLEGTISAKSYYLIERSDDGTISDIPASQKPSPWGGNGLNNEGEHLQLKDNLGNIIDEIDATGGWFAGNNSSVSERASMERVNLLVSGNDQSNWVTNDKIARSGVDAGGHLINGTPKASNSQGYRPTPSPAPTLIPTPTPESTPSPKPSPTPTKSPISQSTLSPSPSPQILATGISLVLGEEKIGSPSSLAGESANPIATSEARYGQEESTSSWQNFLPKIFLVLAGIAILAVAVSLFLIQKRQRDKI